MFVKRLEFNGFRNLENGYIYPSEKINVIFGDNAQGKTNLIECLWLFTGGRSFRGSKEREMIAFGKKEAVIILDFEADGRTQKLELTLKNNTRAAVLNDVQKKGLSQIIGCFCAVVFSPDHLTLIKSGPEERRSFMDGAICQIKPAYASRVAKYKRIINERNALLKDIPRHRELEDTLDIWNERLAAQGAEICAERYLYCAELRRSASAFYDGISSGKEKLETEYRTNFGAEDPTNKKETAGKLLDSLRRRQSDDIYLGYTTSGPHRDDIIVRINGKEARSFGSQGQQRSAVLSMKLAEAEILGKKRGEPPVILLDDVLSELDPSRQDYLLKRLSGMQVFITCCELSDKKGNIMHMHEGKIIREEI